METSKPPRRQATLASLLNQRLDHIERRRTRSAIHEHRRVVEKAIVPALGKHRLDRLSAEHLDRAYPKWAASRLAAATIVRRHAIIRTALTQAGLRTTSHSARLCPPDRVPENRKCHTY